jgi:hypothetical protein
LTKSSTPNSSSSAPTLRRQGRLADVERLGGGVEAARIRDVVEGSELGVTHRELLSIRIKKSICYKNGAL